MRHRWRDATFLVTLPATRTGRHCLLVRLSCTSDKAWTSNASELLGLRGLHEYRDLSSQEAEAANRPAAGGANPLESALSAVVISRPATWATRMRIEWFRDEHGQRVEVNGAGPGSFYEATRGLNWRLQPNRQPGKAGVLRMSPP